MKGSTRAIKQVDPNLRVVSGNKSKSMKGANGMKAEEFDKATGTTCQRCKIEAFRIAFIPDAFVCSRCRQTVEGIINKYKSPRKQKLKLAKVGDRHLLCEIEGRNTGVIRDPLAPNQRVSWK